MTYSVSVRECQIECQSHVSFLSVCVVYNLFVANTALTKSLCVKKREPRHLLFVFFRGGETERESVCMCV